MNYRKTYTLFTAFLLILLLAACTEKEGTEPTNDKIESASAKKEQQNSNQAVEQQQDKMKNNITLAVEKGFVGDEIEFTIDELQPNESAQLIWNRVEGEYIVEDSYRFIGLNFTEKDEIIVEGMVDAQGNWSSTFTVPEGFGGKSTIWVAQGGKKIGQVGFSVETKFTMEPESGPVGTEITIKATGIGWSTYQRNWMLTYDNKYTGFMSAISTNGTGEAKIRAAGPIGKKMISLRTGFIGSGYLNYAQGPFGDRDVPDMIFEVTEGVAANINNYVEPAPVAAHGGAKQASAVNKNGVEVTINKNEAIVGEEVSITATGLPKDKDVQFIFNTMRGSRVSGTGYGKEIVDLGKGKSDSNGHITYNFAVPDDLGGIPHLIDIQVEGESYGQTYLRILPSIVSFEPKSGPVGTKIKVTIKGGGWTEFDNAYYLTYDNAYIGYMCAFNSMGDLTFDVYATGETGHHIIDMYPGIYVQEDEGYDMTILPQLSYVNDHPGSAMPAIRMSFLVTE
ncbi:hypothetical protein [Solibacillus sp. CAU 1738]|uniref:hypothetical protein n=1 Tax=Solibacillus sp. CAU 1738 TaxID=3140363 RepID=UPI0032608EF6